MRNPEHFETPLAFALSRELERPVRGPWRRLGDWFSNLFRMRMDKSGQRMVWLALGFTAVYLMIAGRLVQLAVQPDVSASLRRAPPLALSAARPDIVDRNGVVLATDIKTVSIAAEPRRLVDKDEAVELLTAVLPDINPRELREKFAKRGFVWIKREVTSKQQEEVYRLGLPGINFVQEHKRIYPNGTVAAHILGSTNVDNVGIAGIEKYIDSLGLNDLSGAGFKIQPGDLAPIQLSIDVRVQHALRDELFKGMEKFKAKATAGMILDVTNGEVIALASLPDFNPNNPAEALDPNRINRIMVGVYEMGSTFKALTTAMALDSGKFNINSTLDARQALRYGKFNIGDYHATHRVLTVPEVFIHSSNIGVARMALGVGVTAHQAFLRKMGQLDRLRTELPEGAEPLVPPRWGELSTMTIAFGHGLAVAPIQAVMAVAALTNGGILMPPTFRLRSPEQVKDIGVRVIKPETSEALRYVMRLNAVKGSATRAAIPGYFVGGKTGTAEKSIDGRYAHNRLFTTFMAIAPADEPKYLFLTVMDEPQVIPETHGFATSGWNAAPLTGGIIERVTPMLGLVPRTEAPVMPFPNMTRQGAWGTK
jgi:cell division protein FtsI (penicillin-binding protein 3)